MVILKIYNDMNLQESIRRILTEEVKISKTNMFKDFDISKLENMKPPKNDSEETKQELKYLKSLKLNEKFFKDRDDLLKNFTDFLDDKELKYNDI